MGIRKKLLRKSLARFGYVPTAKIARLTQRSWQPKMIGNLNDAAFAAAINQFGRLSIETTELCHIMFGYGSDKGLKRHNYTALYHALFSGSRSSVRKLLELGIGTNNENLISNMGRMGKPGASLRGWRDYFPGAQVYGADIDDNILFEDTRIKCFKCDQTDSTSIRSLWAKVSSQDMDIVIEDGLHEFDAGKSFLEGSLSAVKQGGYYFVEDVPPKDLPKWQSYFESQPQAATGFGWAIVELPHPTTGDNNMVVLKKY